MNSQGDNTHYTTNHKKVAELLIHSIVLGSIRSGLWESRIRELGAGKEEILHEFAVQGDVKVKECVLKNPHTSPDTVRYIKKCLDLEHGSQFIEGKKKSTREGSFLSKGASMKSTPPAKVKGEDLPLGDLSWVDELIKGLP